MNKSLLFLCLVLFCTSVFPQNNPITVVGTVVDTDGIPLPGANVLEKNSANGVVTNFEGEFQLVVPSDATLVVTFVGFEPQEIPINGQTEFQIELSASQASLDEVVLVGYGTQKAQSVVGAQSTIKAEDLRTQARDLTTAIGGRISGVIATQRGGGPGADGADLFVRGIGTFASSPQGPLLVVDGVPDRTINNIDPEDIESFTVLKDATSTAVYGTRGANGVILINTKSGRPGRFQINAEFNQGVTTFTALPEFLDAPQFMHLYNEGLEARGRTPLYTQDRIDLHVSGEDPDLYPNVDWYDELFNDFGTTQRMNVNINGGSEKATYYLSVGYYGEKGLLKRDDVEVFNSQLKLDRFNFTSNLDLDLTSTTNLEFGVNGFITNLNRPAAGVNSIFASATQTSPHIIPTRYSNGQWPFLIGTSRSPYERLTQSGVTNQYDNTVRSNLRLTQDLGTWVEGLSATAMFAFDVNIYNSLTRSRWLPGYWALGRDENGELITELSSAGSEELGFELNRYGDRRFYVESALNYSRQFGEHDVSGLLLFNQSDYNDATSGVSSYKAAIPYRQRNFVGRATYGFANKYFAEANFSYSGSDNFVADERYGFFPSVGAGWLVSDEAFFKPVEDIFSYFKIRYSYGQSGNAAVSNPDLRFLYLTTIGDSGSYSFGAPGSMRGFSGYNESRIGGNVHWETSNRQNLGIEMNFLNDELRFIMELWKEHREGILIPHNVIPAISGFTASNVPYNNVGETKNKGIDLTLDYNKSWTHQNFFSFRGTFNYNKNEVIFDGLPEWRYPYRNRVGQPISQRYGYVATGLFESEEEIANSSLQSGDVRPGDIRYKDLNGDGVINTDDQAAIGYGNVPRIVYGLSFGGGYKGFDLSLFFQGVGQVDFNYASGYGTQPFSQGSTFGNMYNTVLDRWTVDNPNPDAMYPRLSTNQDVTTNYYTSTWWIHRADYLRLKQAELGYTFTDNDFLRRFEITKLRLYTSGTNLFTLSSWDFWDPELGDGTGAVYPNTTVYNIGFRLNF